MPSRTRCFPTFVFIVLNVVYLALITPPVLAQRTVAIPIVNPSFEDNRIPGNRNGHQGSVTGWKIESGGAVSLATKRGGNAVFAGDVSAAHGAAAAWLSRAGTATQRLEERAEPGMRYTLSVAVGQRTDQASTQYAIQLLGGDNVIASSSEPLPNPGSFIRTMATIEIGDDHPAIGQPLAVRLTKKEGRHICFDDVRLTKTAPLTLAQRIERSVDARLRTWAEKGEFEKSEDHAQRVTEESKAAARDSLEQVVINDIAAGEIDWTSADNRYDADREVFTIVVKDLEPFDVPVPIAEAETFAADFTSLTYENVVFVMSGQRLRLKAVDIIHSASGTTYPVRQ